MTTCVGLMEMVALRQQYFDILFFFFIFKCFLLYVNISLSNFFFIKFYIYGKGTDEEYFKNLTDKLNLNSTVIFHSIVPLQELPQIMGNADLGVEPKSKASFSNEAFSTKILEFMMMNIPVIISDTLIHRYYFNDDQVMFFESDNPIDCARCIKLLKEHKSIRKNLITNANKLMENFNWDKQKHNYISLVNNLVGKT
jgi:glycosyltransferase involved in cell wall biosynthesis